jgi:tRNA A37 methylthiotransferase MiaB
MRKAFVFNVGCIRRALDSIRIYNYLGINDWQMTQKISEADLIVVSTCGAVQEKEDGSINAINKINKKRSPTSRMLISGCLPKINQARIKELGNFEYVPIRELEKFDQLLGSRIKFKDIKEANTINENTDILSYVLAYRLFRNSGSFIHLFNRFSMNRWFLKTSILVMDIYDLIKSAVQFRSPQKIVPYYNVSIAEGCVGDCAYCAIKHATGGLISKPLGEIVADVKSGVRRGHKFIQLVSEDTGCYGIDKDLTIVDLLKKILEIEGDYKLIIIDFNPRWVIAYFDELLPVLVKYQDKIRELFVPLQSGSNDVLNRMNRYYEIDDVTQRLKKIRENAPKIRLRTTIIVGFPGETSADFEKSKQVIQDIGFHEVTLNKYEDRPNSKSSDFEHKISQSLIDKRIREISRYC